ncbi:MAG: hypothetical protein DCF21_14090 [Leptolyngbya sp.]|nr:MAG: hypothetical protein DCF21_14090 [Leptolyngbya sp.]
MAEQRLSFALMLSYLNRVLEGVEDPRQPSNAEGTLGQSLTVKRLKARDLAETQTSYAHHFQPGNVLIPQASYKRLGLEKGQRYEVLATDSHGNGLMLRGQSGVALQVDPAQIRRKSVYEVEEMEIAVGDRLKWTKNHRSPTGVGVGEAYPFAKRLPQQKDNRLRWTRNDYALGRRNGQEFEVVGLEDGQVLICWRRGGVGWSLCGAGELLCSGEPGEAGAAAVCFGRFGSADRAGGAI